MPDGQAAVSTTGQEVTAGNRGNYRHLGNERRDQRSARCLATGKGSNLNLLPFIGRRPGMQPASVHRNTSQPWKGTGNALPAGHMVLSALRIEFIYLVHHLLGPPLTSDAAIEHRDGIFQCRDRSPGTTTINSISTIWEYSDRRCNNTLDNDRNFHTWNSCR
jgi:hypothetical protein